MNLPFIPTTTIAPGRLAASLTLWPIWNGQLQHPYLAVAWTLYCEVLFYAAAALAKINWRIPLIAFGVAMLVSAASGSPLAGFLGNPMVFEFMAGAALTRLPRRAGFAGAALSVAVGLLAVVPNETIGNLDALRGSGGFQRVLAWGIPASLVVYCALTFDSFVSRIRWGVRLGDASYAIYLVFGPITALLAVRSGLLAFAAALAVGIVVHYAIERPILLARPQLSRFALR